MTHKTHKHSCIFRVAALAGSFAFFGTLSAQTPAWFPLQVGNTWLYRATQAPNTRPGSIDERSIWVHDKETLGGREYFDVAYFGREVALRAEPSSGSVFVYDRQSGTEQTWVALGLAVGATFPTEVNPCPTTGKIAARDASVTTAAGQFGDAIQVQFQGNCVDVGVTQQFYAPSVGLVKNEETTIAGPLVYELVYYRVGPSTASAPEVSFTVAIDASRYPAGGVLAARLTLRNTSPDPLQLNFPSGQSADLAIRNEQGELMYLWSTTRLFARIVRNETLASGERTYGLIAPLDGLPSGHYTVEGYLTTNPLTYRAQVSFEITPQSGAILVGTSRGVVKPVASIVSNLDFVQSCCIAEGFSEEIQ